MGRDDSSVPVFQPNATASTVPENYVPLPQILPANAAEAALAGQYEKPRPALRMASTRPVVVTVSAASGTGSGMQFNRHFEFCAQKWVQNATKCWENFSTRELEFWNSAQTKAQQLLYDR